MSIPFENHCNNLVCISWTFDRFYTLHVPYVCTISYVRIHKWKQMQSFWTYQFVLYLFGYKQEPACFSIHQLNNFVNMMTSSNGNSFRVTGPLCGEFTVHRWIPLTEVSDAELWCFRWSVPEQTVEQTIDTPVIRYAIALIMALL